MQVPETISGLWFVADDRAYYVYHSQDPQRLWGGPEDLNTGEGLCKDFPQQCQQLLSGKSTSVIWQGRTTPRPGFADYFEGDTWLLFGDAYLAAVFAGADVTLDQAKQPDANGFVWRESIAKE